MANDTVEPETQILEENPKMEDDLSKTVNDRLELMGDSDIVEINNVRSSCMIMKVDIVL